MTVSIRANAATPTAGDPPGGKKPWVTPTVKLFHAGDAENSPSPVLPDGAISLGS